MTTDWARRFVASLVNKPGISNSGKHTTFPYTLRWCDGIFRQQSLERYSMAFVRHLSLKASISFCKFLVSVHVSHSYSKTTHAT